MGCTQSNRNHPEAKIYDLLESLNNSFSDYSVSEDQLTVKIEKSLEIIEKTIETLEILSPFVAVEIQISSEALLKFRPRLHRNYHEKFQKLIGKSDLSSNRTPRKSHETGTAPPSPNIALKKHHGATHIDNHMRDSSCSGNTHLGTSSRTSGDRSEEDFNTVRLKSFYKNPANQSVETLGEYGFFDEHEARYD